MKYLILFILTLLLLSNVAGQNCQEGYTLFTYSPSSIVKNGSKATVSFAVNSNLLPVGCKQAYIWEFGDGTSASQIVYSSGSYSVQTHEYDLNNSSIVQYGVLQVTARLRVIIYESFTMGSDCISNICYTQDEYVTYTIPSSDWTITLSASPYAKDYPLNNPISLVFNISPANYNQTDNLTYSLEKDGVEIKIGSLSGSDFNKNVSFYSYTPSTASIASYVLVLKRYGNVVGSSFPLTLSVASGGSSGGAGSCLCSQSLDVCLNVTTRTENGKVFFTIHDCSSALFKSTYSGCANFNLWVQSGGFRKVFVNNSMYYGSDVLAIWEEFAPDIYDPPVKYSFYINVGCHDANGNNFVNSDGKHVIAQPVVFNTSENTVQIPQIGGYVSIDTHTPYCKSSVSHNPVYVSEKLDWMLNYSLGDNISFYVNENKSSKNRHAIIKLFVNGNYDKCVDVIDGVKMNYRTISVFQPTKINITQVDKTDPEVISLPFNSPVNTDYVYGPGGYMLTSDNVPIVFENKERIFYFGDENGNNLGSFQYSNVFFNCTDSWEFQRSIVPQLTKSGYSMISAIKSGTLVVHNYIVPLSKSLALFSTNEINLGTDFEIPEGGNFNASIRSCFTDYLKSMDTSLINYPNIAELGNPDLAIPNSSKVNLDVLIYPNPSNGYLIVENKTPELPVTSIVIINSQGILLQSVNPKNNIEVVDLSNNAPGVYFVKISTKDQVIYKKIILQIAE